MSQVDDNVARVFRHYTDAPRWVAWRDDDGNKVPYTPGTDRKALVNKPATWGTLARCGERRGFVTNGDGVGFIDLDGCRDPQTGTLAAWAAELVADFGSYAEVSPSGTGVHIFAAGAPADFKSVTLSVPGEPINGKRPQIEAYTNKRYATVTGDKLPDAPDEIRATPEAWVRLAQRQQGRSAKEKEGRNGALYALGCRLQQQGKNDDEIEAAVRAANVAGNVRLHDNFADGPLTEQELKAVIRSALSRPKGVGALTEQDDPLLFHGDADYQPPRWLVHERIPEQGVGLLSGQWGTFKTFQLLDLCGAVMTEEDWLGAPVCRRGGVLFIAAEGYYEVPLRLQGLVKQKIEPMAKRLTMIDCQRLPFAWKSRCPPLLGQDALSGLVKIAEQAQAQFQARFGLDLVLIVLDTMAAVAGWKDENDNAQAQAAMTVLHQLSAASGAFVLAADHYGKNVQTGTRGASAREASANVVLAALGERDEDGQITETRLTLRKARSGPSGLVFPFTTTKVEMGHDDYDRPVTTLTIDWDVEWQPKQKPKAQSLTLLEQAMNEVLTKNGTTNGGLQTVAKEQVRVAFHEAFRKNKPDATIRTMNEAFRRALEHATHGKTVGSDDTNLWRTEPNF